MIPYLIAAYKPSLKNRWNCFPNTLTRGYSSAVREVCYLCSWAFKHLNFSWYNLGTQSEENTCNTNAKMGKNDTPNNTLTLSGGTSTYLAHTLYMGVPGPPAYICSSYSRAVIKRRGPGISPGYYECLPWLLSKENKRKVELKEVPSCLIPRLLVVFTRQPEILVTTLLQPWYFMF